MVKEPKKKKKKKKFKEEPPLEVEPKKIELGGKPKGNPLFGRNDEATLSMKTDKFILAKFDTNDSFFLSLANVGPLQVIGMIQHMALLLETKGTMSIEETAAMLVKEQANFEQESIRDDGATDGQKY